MDKFFQEAFEATLAYEGGYVNHQNDRGGETNWGITKKLARKYGYEDDMKKLPVEKAMNIYFHEFWKRNRYGEILNRELQKEMFDLAVNTGSRTANRYLQRAYNLLNQKGITVDGIIGPQTLRAVNSYPHPNCLFNLLNGYQARHYINLAEKDKTQKSFIRGWFMRVTIKRWE